jgi:hypothetical protein
MDQERADYAEPGPRRRRWPLIVAILAVLALSICLAFVFSSELGDLLVAVGIVQERAYRK